MEIKDLHEIFLHSSGISTDTRKIKSKSMFFALKGENFNANEFAVEALKKGAKYVIIDEGEAKDNRFIKVENSLKALQQLATFHRKHLGIPILALTGSNGKTTTKELINAVLSKKLNTTATVGNLNNHIGVPLTLLSMTSETEIGIVEMGANHQKEIEFLCNIALPDFGYITNFGKAHLEGFGSVEGIVKGKKELYDHLKQHQKILFLNVDDPLQRQEQSYSSTFSFGADEAADVQVEYLLRNSHAGIRVNNREVFGNLIGTYNAKNMAAAYAMGKYFEVPEEEIAEALENYIPKDNRSQLLKKGSIDVILDAYNANPTSMAAALSGFSEMEKAAKIAILGDMFELGASSEAEHQEIVNLLQKTDLKKTFLVGQNFYKTSGGKTIDRFATFEDFRENFDPSEVENSLLLIKGSRGMALERVLDLLRE